jgi:quercetin dioxygenase-like cupin family protein
MKSKWLLALLVAVLGAAVYGGVVLATPQSGVTTTILAKSTFDDIDLKVHTIPADIWQAQIKTKGPSDIYVVDNKFAPGGTTGWHSHPGPSLIFVVAGTITNYTGDDPSCTPNVYTAGSSFIDTGDGDVHILRNEGSVQAETIAVQFLPKDAVRKIDVPVAPGNCPF